MLSLFYFIFNLHQLIFHSFQNLWSYFITISFDNTVFGGGGFEPWTSLLETRGANRAIRLLADSSSQITLRWTETWV